MTKAGYIHKFGYEVLNGYEILRKMGYDMYIHININPIENISDWYISLPKEMWN